MIMSETVEKASKDKFATIQDAVRTLLQNTSVKLAGQATQGPFIGSGVILYADETNTWILTAKHNLYIFNGDKDPPAWDDKLMTAFQSKVQIYYDAAMDFNKEPVQSAAITSIIPVNQTNDKSWAYDVLILKSTDANLLTFAGLNAAYNTADHTVANVVNNPATYLDTSKGQLFVQLGYGEIAETVNNKKLPAEKPGDNKKGSLQYRIAKPLANALVPVYDRVGTTAVYNQSDDVIQLTADANDSSGPGDSGGPLFIILPPAKNTPAKPYLIGVTTGADMATSKTPCPTGNALRVNNIPTSLQYCYNKDFNF